MPTTCLWFFFFFIFAFYTANSNPEFPCKPPHHHSYPFCNTSLPTISRARSLISLLSLPEKIRQLSNNVSAVPRLGLPSYQWWSEALHGVASNGPGVSFAGPGVFAATSFPQVLLSAAAFNRSLWRSVAAAIGVEARAMYNVGQAGLTFWAPNVNLFRDPRWGRGQEAPGEDPFVASVYAVEFVRGFQGESASGSENDVFSGNEFGEKRVLKGVGGGGGDGSLMVSACCKHFTAYDLEKWGNFSRYSFDAVVSEQDLEDTYQPPFRSCIQQGQSSCLMCSYNRLNGVPACARRDLLEKARAQWGFNGYITSDCDAVATIYEYHKYVKTPEDAVSDVLKAGMDINCGSYLLRNTLSAISKGKVLEEDIDRALFNLFSVQLRLGFFDGDPRKGRFGKLGANDVCSPRHRRLALEAARQGIVLLKNDEGFLPLKKNGVSSLAVIGPVAVDAGKLGGGYSGVPCRPTSLFEGLQEYAERTYYAAGCLDVSCVSDAGFDDAVLIAEKADTVIVVAGLDLSQETEDLDRLSLLLPGKQMALVSSVASVSKKPLVLVLTGGGPLDVSFSKNDPRIASILWVGYPGEAGGRALAEVIFGDYNPGGRLPVTWYPESFTSIPMNDMSMRADPSRNYPGRTYRFYTGDRVYDYGHGLSYGNFECAILSAPNKMSLLQHVKPGPNKRGDGGLDFIYVDELESCRSLMFFVRISVMNAGDMDGSRVVLLYSRAPKFSHGAPQKQLVGFSRVHTNAHRMTETTISVDTCERLTFADEHGSRILPLGDHTLMLEEGTHRSLSIEI